MTNSPQSKNRSQELEAVCSALTAEIGKLEAKISELGSENTRLHEELRHKRGVRAAAHGFYRAMDDAIIAQIDRRGFARNAKKRVHSAIAPDVLKSNDLQALTAAAKQYDTGFFRYKASASGMKLQYRLLSKAYRIGRDTALFGLKKTYRVARKVI